jgi:hypothetical protein
MERAGFGTHAPVLIWYSPEMHAWLKANRSRAPDVRLATHAGAGRRDDDQGDVSVSGRGLRGRRHRNLLATQVLRRDGARSKGSHDGWFWGWYGWGRHRLGVDWPARRRAPTRRWASASTAPTATPRRRTTRPSRAEEHQGDPASRWSSSARTSSSIPRGRACKRASRCAAKDAAAAALTTRAYNDAFIDLSGSADAARAPSDGDAAGNLRQRLGAARRADLQGQFLTSDQCLGCHSAGGTGLQYDMTQPGPDGKLINISPYGTWRGSPMGLAGRDPIFFAQLASETGAFHESRSGSRGHVPRLPRHSGTAPARDRHQAQTGACERIRALDRQRDPYRARRAIR